MKLYLAVLRFSNAETFAERKNFKITSLANVFFDANFYFFFNSIFLFESHILLGVKINKKYKDCYSETCIDCLGLEPIYAKKMGKDGPNF